MSRKGTEKDEFSSSQWYSLVRLLSGVDLLKRGDSNANEILRTGISTGADSLVKTSRSYEAKARDQPLLMIDIIRPSPPPKSESGEIFARLAWGIIGKHQPFARENGGIGTGLMSAEVGDDLWIINSCDQPMILRNNGDHHLVVGEGSYDGANRGELLSDIPDDVRIGDAIDRYKYESINLR